MNRLTTPAIGGVIAGILVIAGISHVSQHRNIPLPPDTGNSGGTQNPTPDPGTSPLPPPPSDKDANGCYTPNTVRNHYDENACIDYNVGYTYEDYAGTKFIDQLVNYTAGFVGYVPYNSAAQGIYLDQLQGKNIKVSGVITQYKGYPEIVINSLDQVRIYNQ
jgi:hypothetical protein